MSEENGRLSEETLSEETSGLNEVTSGSNNVELTRAQKRDNVVRLAFGGDRAKYDEFCRIVSEAVPAATAVVLRGSAVTGQRWKDGAAFDADGPGTSDLDLTLVGGDEVIGLYNLTGFWVPGIHSRPLSDEDPDIAPALAPLRTQLVDMMKRPVNIQGSREMVLYLRGELGGQPYLVLIDKDGDGDGDPDAQDSASPADHA